MKSDRGIRVVLPAGEEAFDDGRLGPRVQNPIEQCGDLLLRDRLNSWTYQPADTACPLARALGSGRCSYITP